MTDIATTELTADEARELTAEIRRDLDGLLPKIKLAFEGRADKALGYGSWQAYCSTELSDVRVPVGDRPAMVAELRQSGMSQRAIGAALGVGQTQIRRDIGQLSHKGSVGQPAKVTSLDGRQRPSTQPTPEPKPEDPVPDFTPLDRQLDAEMEGTAQRFRNNFSTIVCRADDLWQFDVDRIAEVYAADFDQAVRPFLDEMTRWCDRVRSARRDASGLRLVNGASR
jgi:hypothetical protein